MRKTILAATAAASVALVVAGCGSSDADPAASTPAADLTGTLTIFAAASLGEAFDEIAAAFEAEHPGVDVRPVVYDGSSTLAAQLVEGAEADVFASADEKNMTTVTDAGLADDPRLFATNTLVIAVPAGDPGGVEDLSDLAEDSVTTVLCAPEVPCGAASAALLENAGVVVRAASLEQNVKAVLTKVAAREADAGLVYATDVMGDDAVESIVPEGASDVVNHYPIAALAGAPNPAAAEAFAAFVVGAGGQAILARLGFGAP